MCGYLGAFTTKSTTHLEMTKSTMRKEDIHTKEGKIYLDRKVQEMTEASGPVVMFT